MDQFLRLHKLVDEDEGSCLHKQANRVQANKTPGRENRKISGSPPGAPSPAPFPSK